MSLAILHSFFGEIDLLLRFFNLCSASVAIVFYSEVDLPFYWISNQTLK